MKSKIKIILKQKSTNDTNKDIDAIIQSIKQLDLSSSDVSGLVDVEKRLSLMTTKAWIKLIKLKNVISYDIYERRTQFILVAKVISDNSTNATVISFVSMIDKKLYNEKSEWIYIFTINNMIVKIGGTRAGLYGRVCSYLC